MRLNCLLLREFWYRRLFRVDLRMERRCGGQPHKRRIGVGDLRVWDMSEKAGVWGAEMR